MSGRPTRLGRSNRRILAAVLLGVLLSTASPAAAERRDPGSEPRTPQRTGRAIVLLEDGAAPARIAARHGLRRTGRPLDKLDAMTVDPVSGETITELRRRLLDEPGVAAIEPEYRRFLRGVPRAARFVPNDTGFATADPNAPRGAPGQWNLIRSGFPTAWDISRGDGVRVAVVDTGIDRTHPDLQDRVYESRAWVGGYGTNIRDDVGHGTHVAGLACGRGDNGFGITGAGLGCVMYIGRTDLSDGSIAYLISNAADSRADVLNLSLGGPGESTVIKNAIDYAIAKDVVIVAAAANEATEDQGVPAQYLQASGTGPDLSSNRGLVVTSAGFDDQRVTEAGFGTGVSVAAYGDTTPDTPGILSTWPDGLTTIETGNLLPPALPCLCRAQVGGDDRFAYLFGTSMATPQVAGLAALIRGLNPGASADRVVRAIKEGSRGRGTYSSNLGWGIIDATATMGKALLLETQTPGSRVKTTSRVRSRRFTVRVNATDPPQSQRGRDVPASGLERVDVYVARSGRGYRLLRRIPAASFINGRFRFSYRGVRGRLYSFYARARDRAGNEEAAPSGPDSRTRILRRRRR